MLLLGIDLGTSSVKVSVVDSQTQQVIASAQYPEVEMGIESPQTGWAEQSPNNWWENVQAAILQCHDTHSYNPLDITSIGIAYQMHGLVLVDKNQQVLYNSIIWCDSRAVQIGEDAFHTIGREKCLSRLLNSPGNFTASKLAWIKENEPAVYDKIDKILLPGDFIAMKFTGETTTTISALSEGIFWDFKTNTISSDIVTYFGFNKEVFPTIQPLFSPHGTITNAIAEKLSLQKNVIISYKAGDQPNNALSLNVLEPGEVATTAGTSGVVYGVSDQLKFDVQSRVNSFAHVNYTEDLTRIGILLCINGAGIFNRWTKDLLGNSQTYNELNAAAAKVAPGADGLFALPFGNGAERMLENKMVNSHFVNINFNQHTPAHIMRAVQEGIAFAMRYGLDIMRQNGLQPKVVRASKANLFLSPVFAEAFASVNNLSIEYYDGDGSLGAALGAGIGAGIFPNTSSAFINRKSTDIVEPKLVSKYNDLYPQWKEQLEKHL